jgi:pSer/pThr/pTyr-binding forkhead associated (FHA) protein
VAELILEVVEGPQTGRRASLSEAVEVGRDPNLGITFEDEQVSFRHARLTPSPRGAVVEDLGSSNGTYVNGEPIHAPRELNPGDRVRLGLTVLELRSPAQVAHQPSAVLPVPPMTVLSKQVLEPVPQEQHRAQNQADAGTGFLAEETEPVYVPPEVVADPEARSDYTALASLVDAHVKRRTNIAGFVFLSLAGLAVLIFFGVR